MVVMHRADMAILLLGTTPPTAGSLTLETAALVAGMVEVLVEGNGGTVVGNGSANGGSATGGNGGPGGNGGSAKEDNGGNVFVAFIEFQALRLNTDILL